jgi:DNA (cytosine-5)-methyltransferase 1
MRIGSLFAGIGGFDLAARWMGWETAWFSEIDPYASAVLAKHWPDVPNHGDITQIDFTQVEPVDMLCGGFPCQPHSVAGKKKGSADERDLWPEYERAIRILRPRYIVAENVPGLFASDGGRFFGRVLGALAALGYDAEWTVLSGADVGAPHERERVWIVAYPGRERDERRGISGDVAGASGEAQGEAREREWGWRPAGDRSAGILRVADADSAGCGEQRRREPVPPQLAAAEYGSGELVNAEGERRGEGRAEPVIRGGWNTTASASIAMGDAAGARRSDGRPGAGGTVRNDARRKKSERRGGRLCGWDDAVPVRGADGVVRLIPREAAEAGPESPLWPVADGLPGRVARLRGIGNAIVPQCALEIFRAIEAAEAARRVA